MWKRYVLLAVIGLGACSSDPSAYKMDFNDGGISGSYSPEGWTSEEVRTSVVSRCPTGKAESYSETPQSNGWIKFIAICENAT